jgi:predicted nucleic acid-binding protein
LERELHLSVTALGEFREGFDDPDDPVLRTVRELHVLLVIDEDTALEYGRIARRLRTEGRLIGTNDLWIAATSIRHGIPLVTANSGALARIDGLEVISYR